MILWFQNLITEHIIAIIILINIAFFYFVSTHSNSKELNKKDIGYLSVIIISSKAITVYMDYFKENIYLSFNNTILKFVSIKNPINDFFNYIIDTEASLSVFLGVVSLLATIYIYCISLENNFKRHVLMTLLGQGKVLYMSILLLVLYCIGVSPVLFLSLIFLIFLELYRMIQEIFSITNTVYFKKNWKEKIIPRLREQDDQINLANIYYQLKEEIVKSMTENNFIAFAELFYYYQELLMTTGFKIPDNFIKFSKSKEDKEGLNFFYAIYKELKKNNNDNFFNVISSTSTTLGEYYINEKNKILGYGYCRLRKFKYYYLKNNKLDDKELMEYHLFTGYKYYGTLDDDISEDINVYILKSTLDLFNEMIKEEDYINLLEFQDILGEKNNQYPSYIKNDYLNEYVRLILIFILEKKKSISNSEELESTLNELKSYYIFLKHTRLLEDIYDSNIKYNWDEFFNIDCFLREGQLDNISTHFNSVNDIILQILNDQVSDWVDKNFILNNYEKIEDVVKRLKLTKLEKRMNSFSNEIKIDKAKNK